MTRESDPPAVDRRFSDPRPRPNRTERTAGVLRAAFLAAVAVLLLWLLGPVLLELFAALLLAVLLHGLTGLLSRHSGLPRGWAFALVTIGLVTLVLGAGYLMAPHVVEQGNQVVEKASRALEQLSRQLHEVAPGLKLPSDAKPSLERLTTGFVDAGSMVAETIVAVVIVLFVGFYAAVRPGFYVEGALRLVPSRHRARAREVLHETGRALQWWLLGRAILMLGVFLLTLAGLWLLSIPLAFALSVIAGLLTFVPYVGAIVSAVPAMLIGFARSPLDALWVMLLFLGAHALEGYVLAPLVEQRIMRLPPALMLSTQAVIGTLFGVIGVTLSAPITVVAMVAIQQLYLRDTLGEPPAVGIAGPEDAGPPD